MKSLFRRAAAPLAGIDIGETSVKLVELRMDAPVSAWTLERCAIELLPPGAIHDGNLVDVNAVANAVRRVLRRDVGVTRRITLALPSGAVISREVTLPANLNEREMELQIEAEANQYVPFPLDEVNLDFCVLGPSKSSPGDVDVAMVAARREKVDRLQAVADGAGVTLEVLDVDAFAARRALTRAASGLPGVAPGAVVVLLDLRRASTMLRVLRDDKLLYERELLLGGQALTQDIAHQYSLAEDEAEQRKCTGDLPPDYADSVHAAFLSRMAQEITGALGLFFTSTSFSRVDVVLLSGGGASLAGLPDAVQAACDALCHVVNPFAGMEMTGPLAADARTSQAPRYLTACGLAMRRFFP